MILLFLHFPGPRDDRSHRWRFRRSTSGILVNRGYGQKNGSLLSATDFQNVFSHPSDVVCRISFDRLLLIYLSAAIPIAFPPLPLGL